MIFRLPSSVQSFASAMTIVMHKQNTGHNVAWRHHNMSAIPWVNFLFQSQVEIF